MSDLIFKSETHEYFFKGEKMPCVSDVLSEMGFIDTSRFKPEHAKRGEIIHTITQLYDEGELDETSVDPSLIGYYNAYKKFRSDFKDRLQIMDIEKPVYNHKYRYAGTPDRLGYLDKTSALYDIKSGVYQYWHILQVVAYALCFEPMPKKLFCLYLNKNGSYKAEPVQDPSARNAWIGLFIAYEWKMRNKK